MSDIAVEEWEPAHVRWQQLIALVTELSQMDWLTFRADWHANSHVLAAKQDQELVGFLRFVVQEIGPDAGCPPIQWQGGILQEAKVIAFGVAPAWRGKGIGRQLQPALH